MSSTDGIGSNFSDNHMIFRFLQTPVYVYYESLCPDSQAFITKQLYPSMKILKDHVELHLVPFGKSTYQTRGSDTTFECHHGPNEVIEGAIHHRQLYNLFVFPLSSVTATKSMPAPLTTSKSTPSNKKTRERL